MDRGEKKGTGSAADRLNVGVLLDSVESYFNHLIISELLRKAEELGIRLVFFFGGQMDRGAASGNYSWIYSLPGPEVVDAVIVLPNSIAPFNPTTAAKALLERLGDIPVYALFSRLEGIYSVDCDEGPAIERMVRHLAEIHGYRRFSVLLGPDSDESLSSRRLRKITELLGTYSLSIPDEWVFPGDFSLDSGTETARKIYRSKAAAPDVLICMNDRGAASAIAEFVNNGISVPQDIAVVSFDEAEESAMIPCSLSSVVYPISTMIATLLGRIASDFGKITKYESLWTEYPASYLRRDSCGCNATGLAALIPAEDLTLADDQMEDDELLRKESDFRHNLRDVIKQSMDARDPAIFAAFVSASLRSLYNFGEIPPSILDAFSTQWTIALLQAQDPEEQTFMNSVFIDAFRYLIQARVQKFKRMHQRDLGALEFYKKGNELLAEKTTLHDSLQSIAASIPALAVNRAQLVLICPDDPKRGEIRIDYRRGNPLQVPEGNFTTLEIESLLSLAVKDCGAHLMLFCLAHNHATFGYLALSMSEDQFDQFWLIQETLSHIIESAVTNDELTAHIRTLTRKNYTLSQISLIDEFTGLYNRRALYSTGKERFERALSEGKSGGVIFVDMDGLKAINDTWGHKEGDTAILALSDIFKRSFRDQDLLVRYGGDEFIVILTDVTRETLDKALARIEQLMREFNEKKLYPWVLSASWGFVFTPPGEKAPSLERIIEESDLYLYNQKRQKKSTL